MWQQLDNIGDFYNDQREPLRRKVLRVLRQHVKKSKKRKGKK